MAGGGGGQRRWSKFDGSKGKSHENGWVKLLIYSNKSIVLKWIEPNFVQLM